MPWHSPSIVILYHKKGVSFAIKGDYKSALKFYNKALKIHPNSTNTQNLRLVALQVLQDKKKRQKEA